MDDALSINIRCPEKQNASSITGWVYGYVQLWLPQVANGSEYVGLYVRATCMYVQHEVFTMTQLHV